MRNIRTEGTNKFWVNGPFINSQGERYWEVAERRFANVKHYVCSRHYTAKEAEAECAERRKERIKAQGLK